MLFPPCLRYCFTVYSWVDSSLLALVARWLGFLFISAIGECDWKSFGASFGFQLFFPVPAYLFSRYLTG